jgi:Family of unknown function (DUF5684)
MEEEQVMQAAGMGAMGMIFTLAILVFMVATMWRIFTKAGKPGWAAIIPIYNVVVMLQIAGKPIWWIIGLFIPFINLVVMILLTVAIAKAFGKGVGFAIGMLLVGVVFYPILAFGSATYTPPAES